MLGSILTMACMAAAYVLGVVTPHVFRKNDAFYEWAIHLLLYLFLFAAQMAREL